VGALPGGNQSSTMTYTVTVNNAGPDPATAIVATINLQNSAPNVFTAQTIGAAGNCSPAAPTTGVLTCNIGTLAAGANMSFTIAGTNAIDPNSASALFTTTAGVASTEVVEQNAADNNSSDSRLVQRIADIQITGVVATPKGPPGPDSPPGSIFVVTQHTNLQYDITVANNGPDDATNVILTDVLPPNTNFGSASAGCVYAAGPNSVTCTIGTLASGANTVVTITLQPIPPGSSSVNITNNPNVASTSISDPNPSNNGGLNNTVIQTTQADLGVSVATPSNIVRVGAAYPADRVVYNVTAANNGPSNATNIVLTDVLPANLTFDPAQSAGFCSALGQTVTCNIASMNASTTNVFNIVGIPNMNTALSSTQINNNVTIASNTIIDNTSANNSSNVVSHTLRGQADVQLTMTTAPVPQNANAAAGEVLAGDNIDYVITLRNNGPYPAESITVQNTFPAGLTFVSVNAPSFSGCVNAANVETCTLGALAVGGQVQMTVRANVPASAITGLSTTLNDTAFVTTYNAATVVLSDTDDVQANNTVATAPVAKAAADLQITQSTSTPNVSLVAPGALVANYLVTVSNVAGRSAATNVVLTNNFNVQPLSSVPGAAVTATPSQGACSINGFTTAGANVTCNFGTIASGASATVTITLDPTQSGLMTNTPSVTRSEVDPIITGDVTPATLSVTVNNTPVGSPVTVAPADPVTGVPSTVAQLTFNNVTVAGTSTMTTSTGTSPLVFNYKNGLPTATYYSVATTATYGSVTLCVTYPETFLKENRARMFIGPNGGAGTDVTTSINTTTNVICGSAAGINSTPITFVVLEPINHAPSTTGTATPQQVTGKGVTGTSVRLDTNSVSTCTAAAANCNADVDTNVCNGGSGTCGDALRYTWTGNFTDGTTKQYACAATDAPACRQLDVSLPVGSQNLTLRVEDGEMVAGTFVPYGTPFGGNVTRQVAVTISAVNAGGNVSTVNVSRGQAATFTVNLNYDGTGGQVTIPGVIGVQGTNLAAAQITCNVTPTTVTAAQAAANSGSVPVTIVCNTTAPVFASAPREGGNPIFASILGLGSLPLVGIVLLPAASRRRRIAKFVAFGLMLMMLVTFQVACGGGSSSGFSGAPTQTNAGTPQGAYKIDFAQTIPVAGSGTLNGLSVQTSTPAQLPLTLNVQ
jgi:uncharacterized repeat protein (TIGR01451 family)